MADESRFGNDDAGPAQTQVDVLDDPRKAWKIDDILFCRVSGSRSKVTLR